LFKVGRKEGSREESKGGGTEESKKGRKNRLQEAITVIGTLMPWVKGVLGLGGRASVPKGADVLYNPYGGTRRATLRW
jgi:hypothetical protein